MALPVLQLQEAVRPIRSLVILPTHNEAENLRGIVKAVLGQPAPVDLLIVDGASTDGTPDIADELAANCDPVSVLHRWERGGLGRAYVDGFRYAIEKDYDAVIQCDADFSHPPEKIPALLDGLEHADLIIGSRYVPGSAIEGWNRSRWLLSRSANFYVKTLTGLPMADATGGFKALSRGLLETIDGSRIRAHGHAFQIEANYLAWRRKFRIREIPITFRERRAGSSKVHAGNLLEALLLTPRLPIIY